MTDALILIVLFVVGALIILGRLAWVHRIPGLPRRIRKLGPLPPDPGMPKRPPIDGDPFRE